MESINQTRLVPSAIEIRKIKRNTQDSSARRLGASMIRIHESRGVYVKK
jgi:hypothetical protein